MRYVDRGTYIEHHPETQRDIDYLVNSLGARLPFDHWCVAKPPTEWRPPTEAEWVRLTRAAHRLNKAKHAAGSSSPETKGEA